MIFFLVNNLYYALYLGSKTMLYNNKGYVSIEDEYKLVNSYISVNPYLSKADIILKLKDYPGIYTDFNYIMSKKLYENITNEKLCRKIGKYIYNIGGFDGMRHIYSIVIQLSPLDICQNITIKNYSYNLSIYWDGIRCWSH